MYNTNNIKIVEELTQEQLDTLKGLVFWHETRLADYNNISKQEEAEIDEALFERDIPNTTIYKLYRDIYFTDKALATITSEVA